jgi:hypothetical protein
LFRDGTILGGDPYFWSAGSYTVGKGTWKGEIVTNQHTPYHETDARPVFGRRDGYHGLFRDVQGWQRGGIRNVAGRQPQRQFSRDIAPACG